MNKPKKSKRRKQLIEATKRRLREKYPLDEPDKASSYIVHFKKLVTQNRSLKVVLYCRVSRCQQKENGNLSDQQRYLRRILHKYERKYDVKIIIVAVFEEVASGWDGDRKVLIAAADKAKKTGAILVAESTCRYIRNENYHSYRNFNIVPTSHDYEALIDSTEGVTLATVMHPNKPWYKVKAYHTKRGQRSKNKFGGRPLKKYPGYMKDRRKKRLHKVLRLNKKGYSIADIVRKTKIPRSTINDWIRKYKK